MRLNAAIRLDAGMDKWLRRFAWENHWRVAWVYTLEDLIQDGYLYYVKCRNTYPDITERRHFMRLFQTSFRNHITDLANRNRRVSSATPTAQELRGEGNVIRMSAFLDERDEARRDELFGIVLPDTELLVLLSEARGVVKRTLELFTSEAGLATVRAHPQRSHEATNAYLCRVLDIGPGTVDIPAMVTSFLRGSGRYYLRHRHSV
jgi:hypothetical protein